jgi:REP element-mobilizing transposase RayT
VVAAQKLIVIITAVVIKKCYLCKIKIVKIMDDKLFNNKYRIPSARATFHDYNGGAYFVTICTKNSECFFGEIVGGADVACRDVARNVSTKTMQLSEIGKYADENLRNITHHYPYAGIPLFIVMPNHIHAIVFIDGVFNSDVARNVSTTVKNEKMVEIAKHQSLLAVALRGFKSAITKFATGKNINFAWQTRFHDHIIRNQDEMNHIAKYIENNVFNWETDELNNNTINP